ncbi:MAG: hypothetical protein ACJAXR_000938 [Halopseudomonas sp.]|jgi:hypothetical protein
MNQQVRIFRRMCEMDADMRLIMNRRNQLQDGSA